MRLQWRLATLFVFNFLCCPTGALATLLFSGGEDIDFICNGLGSCSVQTNSSDFRPAWARSAYQVTGTTTDPPSNRFATPTFAANSTIWIHAQFCNGSCYVSNNPSGQMFRVMDSVGNPTLVVTGTGTAGQLQISSRTATGTFTSLVTCPLALNSSLTQVDLYVNYGTAGEVTFYNNGVKVCDFSGNVTNGDGATTLNQVEFASPTEYDSANWSEIIIATTDTRAMARFTANTVANGNTTGFSGSNICSSIWNATAFNDANYGYSGTANILHECTVNSAIPPGAYTVLGLVMSARALVGSSGPLHFDFLTRVNGTDYPSADFAPTNGFSNFTNYLQTVNPATSNPWSVSDFQAAGFNVGEETKP
jgi:hypothetical protein